MSISPPVDITPTYPTAGVAAIAQLDYYVIIFYDRVIRLFPQEKRVSDAY